MQYVDKCEYDEHLRKYSVYVCQVQKFCTMVLSAMMAGMDDKEDVDDIITLEAMSSLSKILSQVAEKDIQAILINITLRIRPCFEKVTRQL